MRDNGEIEHTGDRAFAVHGDSLRELFEGAAQAVFATQEVLEFGSTVAREIRSTGRDRETLLVNWLNEILYLQDVHNETYERCELSEVSGTELRAQLFGVLGSARRPIKAVTFHNLRIEATENGLQATLVFDV